MSNTYPLKADKTGTALSAVLRKHYIVWWIPITNLFPLFYNLIPKIQWDCEQSKEKQQE